MLRLALSFALLSMCEACGPRLANTSAYLEPATAHESPSGSGDICFLSAGDRSVRLMARGREGVVRIRGATVRLAYQGDNLRGGGTFWNGALTIQITNVPYAAAHAPQRSAEMAVISVDDGDVHERFSGLWDC